jgi:hypothetical protein
MIPALEGFRPETELRILPEESDQAEPPKKKSWFRRLFS